MVKNKSHFNSKPIFRCDGLASENVDWDELKNWVNK